MLILTENKSVAAYQSDRDLGEFVTKTGKEITKFMIFVVKSSLQLIYNNYQNGFIVVDDKKYKVNYSKNNEKYIIVSPKETNFDIKDLKDILAIEIYIKNTSIIYGVTTPRYNPNSNNINHILLSIVIPDSLQLYNNEYLLRLRIVIYHELNHCYLVYHINQQNKKMFDKNIKYSEITNLLNISDDFIKNYSDINDAWSILNDYCKKYNFTFKFPETFTLKNFFDTLFMIYMFFDKNERNSFIAETYGQLEQEGMNNGFVKRTVPNTLADFLSPSLKNLNISQHIKTLLRIKKLLTPEITSQFKQFFVGKPSNMTDEGFYNWFIKTINLIEKKLARKCRNVIILYNNTIDEAIAEHNKETYKTDDFIMTQMDEDNNISLIESYNNLMHISDVLF